MGKAQEKKKKKIGRRGVVVVFGTTENVVAGLNLISLLSLGPDIWVK